MINKKKITNITTFNYDTYEKVAKHLVLHDSSIYLCLITIFICVLDGIYQIYFHNVTVATIINIILGLVVLPIYTFIIRYILYKKEYDKMLEATNGKILIQTCSIEDNKITVLNTLNQKKVLEFKQIIKIYSHQDLIVLKVNDKKSVYLDPNGFNVDLNEAMETIKNTK